MTGPAAGSASAGAAKIDAALWRTGFTLVLGTFMASLDATIVAVGIETLARDLDASVAEIQWVTTAYLLAVVAAVPTSGWLVDRFGGRRTWLCAIGVFLAGSLLCALAWSVASLVVFRVLQGLGGGLLPPTGQTLLARAAGPRRIGRVISVVALVPLLSPVLGPLAGGAILGVADWPWLFYVNLPIGLVAVALALRTVPAGRAAGSVPAGSVEGAGGRARSGGVPFDLRGATLLSPGLAVLVFGLTLSVGGVGGERAVPTPVAVGAVLVGAGMLAGFLVHGLRTSRPPLIDPRLFTRPPFGSAALALVVLGASVFGAMFLLPLYLQTGPKLSAWETGVLLAPQGLGALIGSLLVNRTVDKVAPRSLVLCGIGLIALGTVLFTQLGHSPGPGLVAASLLVRGVGIAMIGAPVMNIVYSSMEPAHIPRASGALNLLNTVGGTVGTAVLAVILQGRLAARGVAAGEPAAVAAAFADVFWWVLAFCLVAAVGAVRLPKRATPA